MKASVPTPDNSARPSPKGRIFGLKRSTLSLITALTIGTPLLVACDNADSIPVNTEVTSTPVTTTTEQTTAPTTTSKAPVVESTTSKAPKPESTTEEKPTETPTTTVEPEPTEPEVDLGKVRKEIEQFLEEQPGGQSKNITIQKLIELGYTEDEASAALDALNIDWYEQAVIEAEYVKSMPAFLNPGEFNYYVEIHFQGFTSEEIEHGIDSLEIDWAGQAVEWTEVLFNSNVDHSKKGVTKELQLLDFSDDHISSAFKELEASWDGRLLDEAKQLLDSDSGISRSELRNELATKFEGFVTAENVDYAFNSVDVDWNNQALQRGYVLMDSRYTTYSYYDIYDELTRAPLSFTHDEALYAQENLDVDWDAQATKELDSYLSWADFSKARATSQLIYTGYTPEQAEAAVASKADSVWRDNAVREARLHLRSNSPSRAELIDYLTTRYSTSFTQEEAEYAADQVGLTK